MQQPESCGFLIVRGSPVTEFLLMKHASRWDLPKGHVDPGETHMECALRELEEETGIRKEDIDVDSRFVFEHRYLVDTKRYGGKGKVEKTLRIFLGHLHGDVEIKPTEHQGFQWFPWSPPHAIQEKTIDPLLQAVELHLTDR
ncbi:MAG: NUDIX domain-containing protein [Planctomycetaceae bacterium]|nr:NUDIX domain-containing protein [Planctomycetaceae bacterium]